MRVWIVLGAKQSWQGGEELPLVLGSESRALCGCDRAEMLGPTYGTAVAVTNLSLPIALTGNKISPWQCLPLCGCCVFFWGGGNGGYLMKGSIKNFLMQMCRACGNHPA